MAKYFQCVLITFLLLASGCSLVKDKPSRYGTSFEHIRKGLRQDIARNKKIDQQAKISVPDNVSNALIPGVDVNVPDAPNAKQTTFDLAVRDVPAKTFFMGLVKDTPYNMIVSPNVAGSISLKLNKVNLFDVLEAVREAYGYEYELTGYAIHVKPPQLERRIFNVNYLDIVRNGSSRMTVSNGEISHNLDSERTNGTNTTSSSRELRPGSSIETKHETDFWDQLKKSLTTLVGEEDGRSVVVNPQAGVVVVRAYTNELRKIADYLANIQNNLDRQVILEAKILEVELTKGYEAGINWNLLSITQNGNTFSDDPSEVIGALNIVTNRTFKATINLLAQQGNVQVLSSPRISTINNQKAVIKVGGDEFFVTGVSTTNTSGVSETNTQDVELTPFFTGISLDVTPQIERNGTVTLHIHPAVSTVIEDRKTITLGDDTGNQVLPLAKSTIRESDNIVSAQNGQIVVIGGLMQNKMSETVKGTPLLSRIPLFGNLFKDNSQSATRSELVILLRPIVVGEKTWTEQLQQIDKRTKRLKRGFHFGAFPEEFGTMAEGKS